jgi:hypothetical protein
MALVRTDVTEEPINSIIGVKRISKLGTTFAVTRNYQHVPVKFCLKVETYFTEIFRR